MATFKSTTFGKISGKFGDALATQSKATGKNYLRVASVPTNPRTPKQVAHRARFGYINQVLVPFYPVFKANFGGHMGIRYGINIAFKEALMGEYPDFSLDFEKVKVAEGGIAGTYQVQSTRTEPTKCKFDWDTTITDNHESLAKAKFVFFNLDLNQVLTKDTEASYDSGTVEVEIPVIWKDANVLTWLYFVSSNGINNSNSQFLGAIPL